MLKRDVHRMQIRAEEVERQTKMMMGAIEEFVDRRENLVDKVGRSEVDRGSRKSEEGGRNHIRTLQSPIST